MTNCKWLDWNHLFQTYKEIVTKGKTVIEIGSSNISRTIELTKHCKQLIGVEKYKDRIHKNKVLSKYHGKILNGDWQYLTKYIAPQSADIIIASHVIEHVEDDINCLNESHKVLKNGGYLLFNTPNRKRLTRSIIEVFSGERVFPYWEHIREYTRIDLEQLIKNSLFSYSKTNIIGVGVGVHVGKFKLYVNKPPTLFDKLSTYWEVLLQK